MGKDLKNETAPDEHGGELDDGGVEEPPVRGGSLLSCSVACTRGMELQLVLLTLRADNYITLQNVFSFHGV